MSKTCSSSSIFLVFLLFLILSGYSLCDSEKDTRRNRRVLNERQKLRNILQELQKETRLYSHSIDRFNRNASRDSTELKKNIVKGRRNEKRQIIRENSLTDCSQLREECFYMINFISSNLQAAEIALANIKNVIWRFQPLDPSTGGLVKCLQCSQYEQNNPIPFPTSLYPADLTAPENVISYNYSYYMPAYYNNPSLKNNPAINNNNYQNPYTVPEAYGSPNTLKNMYSNNQPNFYVPNLKKNPNSYHVPYYYNNSNYQFQNLHTQNNYSIARPNKNSNFNFGSGLRVVDRMMTRDTKNKNSIKQNYNDEAIITKDLSNLKKLKFSSLKGETNQGMQSQESTSLSSKTTKDSNSVSPFMCYWPSICFFNRISGQQVQAPDSAAINSLPSVSRNLSWNPANSGSNFGNYNPFISSEFPRPCSQFFGPNGAGENIEGHSTVNQPVICSYMPPYDFQGKSRFRDSGKQENKETDPRSELKNREYHFYSAEQTTEAFINKNDQATAGEVVEEVAVKNFNSPKAAEKPVDNENFYGTETSIYPDENSFNDQNKTDLNTNLKNEENITDDTGDAVNEMTESSSSRYDYDNDILEIGARAHKNNAPTKAFNDTWKLIESTNDFICSNITQVISRSLRCDKKIDCEDGTDELNCRCIDILTIKHPLSICDGRIDCADKSDEIYCNDRSNDQDTYLCPRSAVFIPAGKKCNGKTDCQLHDDEKDCYALTNGNRIELDLEGSTILKKNGIVSINRDNIWRILCFDNTTDLEKTADNYCSAVGFYKHESASFHYVDEKILEVHPSSEISSITFNRREILKNISRKNSGAVMCHALYVDCSMNFNKPVYDYLYKSNLTNNETYLLPWEPAIFVDGKYHCPALLLNTEWAMTSTHCTNDINLGKNITAIIAGLSMPHQYVDGPHQQTRMVNHIENLDQFHTSLLHFDKLPVTRYIKPIFINNRPLAATGGEYCQATGVNKKLEKQSVGFDAVVEDCPLCKRCFRDLLRNWCPKNGTMEKWSGFISCHNSRGWYPAAVFHERDILCEFENPQALIGIEEMLPYLTTIMDENDFKLPNAQCDADDMKCPEGKCLPFERICDGIQDCRDGSDENEGSCLRKKDHCNDLVDDEPNNPLCGIRCSSRQLRCENGDCISKDLFCDGYADCGDGSDEPLGCSCRDYLRLTSPHRLCNKVRDCFDKSDEAQEYCSCSNDHYECSNSTMTNGEKQCIPYDFVCDGHKDCLHGEDESLCRMIQRADDTLAAGRVLKRQLGVWFDECFPHPINSDQQAAIICTTMGYSSGVLLDEISRSAYPPPQTIQEAPYYTINLNGLALIILKDDVPSATLVTQLNECNRAFVKCFY